MKTEYPGVEWLLDCEPRLAQLEALARSYTGIAYRDHRDHPMVPKQIRSTGPARGWGHFMQQRVGKTPTALNEYLLFKRDYGFHRALIWSPNKYKYTWAKEVRKFGIIDEPVHVFESKNKEAARKFVAAGKGILIVNWEACAHEQLVEIFAPFIDDLTYIAGDESILVKNKESVTFKTAKRVTADLGAVRLLTGKPLVQGPHDLYSQLRLARKIEGWEYNQWKYTFCKMGGFKGRQIIGVKEESVEQMQKILFMAAFHARRADWTTSFEPDYETRPIDMTPEQLKHYNQMEDEFIIWLESGEAVSVEQIITKHEKLTQISSGFIYDEYQNAHWLIPPKDNPKLNDLKFSLENIIEGKTIVIATHAPVIDMLMEQLAEYKPAVIRGGVAGKHIDVEEEKRRFNEEDDCRVIIGQERAIKYGHTLMGTPEDPCQTTYYFENSYSLDDRDQSEQRNQGYGQLSATNVVDPICSPIEAKIVDALQRKETVAAVVLGYYKGKKPNRSLTKNVETLEW